MPARRLVLPPRRRAGPPATRRRGRARPPLTRRQPLPPDTQPGWDRGRPSAGQPRDDFRGGQGPPRREDERREPRGPRDDANQAPHGPTAVMGAAVIK